MNTSYPGRIVSFDPVKQLASVEVLREQYLVGVDILYKEVSMPILKDIPVHFPQSKGFCITFPIQVGDYCLLIFSDKGYDHWLYEDGSKIGKFSDNTPKPDFFKDHDISDAIAIVGVNSILKAIKSFNPSSAEFRNANNDQRITLNPDNTIEINTTNTVTITAPTVNIVGNVNITGALTVSETIVAQGEVTGVGVNLSTHIHGEVTPGQGYTGVPE